MYRIIKKFQTTNPQTFSDNPEALDSLSGSELYVQLLCEKSTVGTYHKIGVTWNEEFAMYLRSPVTAILTAKVSRSNLC